MSNLFDVLLGDRREPDRTAIETPDGGRTTYADLHAASGRMANLLRSAGIKPGDRVTVQVEK